MVTHSSILAWRIPWTEESDGLWFTGSQSQTLLKLFSTHTYWHSVQFSSVAQSWPALCDPMDCSLQGSSVSGDSPGKNTGVSYHALFQGILPTQVSNSGLLHCRQILYCLRHQGSPGQGFLFLNEYTVCTQNCTVCRSNL